MHFQDIDSLLDRHRDKFRRLLRAIAAEEEGEDPYRIPLDRFLAMTSDEKAEVVQRAATVRADRIERELRNRNATWVILAGDEVVASSENLSDLPSPQAVLDMGAPKGLVAYLFEGPWIEEIPHLTVAAAG